MLVPRNGSPLPTALTYRFFARHLARDTDGSLHNLLYEVSLCYSICIQYIFQKIHYLNGQLHIDGCAPVRVLFDETFVTTDSSSVHVLCIDCVIDSTATSVVLSQQSTSRQRTSSDCSTMSSVDSISTTLFGLEADMRFEANVQASCCQMRRRLLAENDFCHRSVDYIKVFRKLFDMYILIGSRRSTVQ